MPALSSCPTPRELKQFVLGRTSEAEAAAVRQHLARCPRCLKALETLEAQDRRTDAVPSAPARPVPLSRSKAIEGVIDRRGQDRPAGSRHPGEATASGASLQTTAPAAVGSDHYDFLAPPQEPDEIGRLGKYRVLKVLGAGGMGVVFQAEDPALHRLVALKTLKPGLGMTDVNRKRFLREAQATAAIEHDHIVPIYQVDEVQGVPFLAMQFLKGETLDQRLQRQKPLPSAEVLRIGREIAAGLAAAHERALIHRDIKPSNIWLEAGSGRVKLVDFGLARSEGSRDAPHLTETGFVLGTPGFMAPEQARGLAVDGRCDLFSLGCVLYLMATGRAPFHAADTLGMLVAVATETPRSAGELNPALPPALVALVTQLLAKDPAQRPPSARAVIEALQAIEGETALPPSVANLPTQMTLPLPSAPRRSRRPMLAVVVLLLGALAVGGYVYGPALLRPAADLGRLIIDAEDASVEIVLKQGDLTIQPQTPQREFALRPGTYEVLAVDGLESLTLFSKKVTIVRGGVYTLYVPVVPELAPPEPPTPGDTPNAAMNLGTVLIESDNSKVEVVIKQAGRVVVPRTGERQLCLPAGSYDIELAGSWPALELFPAQFALKDGEETTVTVRPKNTAVEKGPLSPVALVARPAQLAGIRNWTVETRSHRGPARNVIYSPDGRWLASGGSDGTVRVWEANTRKLVRAFVGHGHGIESLGWSDNSKTLISLGHDFSTVRLWDVEIGRRIRIHHMPMLHAIALSPDGKVMATAGVDKVVKLWNADTGTEVAVLTGQAGEALAWSPDGRVLAAAGDDRSVLLWTSPADKPKPRRLVEHKDAILALAWSPDGKVLASAGKDRKLLLWDAERDKVLRSHAWEPTAGKGKLAVPVVAGALAWSAKTRTLASINSEGVQLWKPEEAKVVKAFPTPGRTVSWSADAKTLAIATNDDETIQFCEAGTGKALAPIFGIKEERITAIAWSPDGSRLAGMADKSVRVWSAATGKLVQTLEGHTSNVVALAWSPDGKRLAGSGGFDQKVLIWDAAAGKVLQTLTASQRYVGLVAWSPNGKTVAAATDNTPAVTLYLWDADSGKVLHQLTGHATGVNGLTWSADSKVLISAAADSSVRFWSARTGKPLRSIRPYTGAVWAIALSPDGKVLATAGESAEPMLRLYDADTGALVRDIRSSPGKVVGLRWLPDGKTLVVRGDDHGLRFLNAGSGALLRSVTSRPGIPYFLPERGVLANGAPAVALRLRDLATNRTHAVLLLSRQGTQDAFLTVAADGHYCGSPRLEQEVIYVVQVMLKQEIQTPEEFAKSWKNDPGQVRFGQGR